MNLSIQLAKTKEFPKRSEFRTFWDLVRKYPVLAREIADFADHPSESVISTEEALEIFDIELIRKLHSK